jgi:hypothetical protein
VNGADFIPPQASALEVSLFGCGVGESLALHLGNGEWVLVDACRANRSDLPLNLAYLYSLGLDPAAIVKLFVVTHWHDDYINGAAEIVKRCSGARISFSGAMARDEFRRLVFSFTQDGYVVDREKSGVREMGRILKILRKRLCHVGRGPWSEPWPKLRSSGEQLHVRLGIFECSGQRVVSLISLLPARRLRSSKRPHSGCAPDMDTTQEMGLSQYSVRHNFGMRY